MFGSYDGELSGLSRSDFMIEKVLTEPLLFAKATGITNERYRHYNINVYI